MTPLAMYQMGWSDGVRGTKNEALYEVNKNYRSGYDNGKRTHEEKLKWEKTKKR